MNCEGELVCLPECRVWVRAVGQGAPLLLINGLGAHSAMWAQLEQTLHGRHIVEFDLPGAGRSDVPLRPPSIQRLARLTASVMDHFGLRRCDVLGYSMGGVVAQQLAADQPERVRRMVLLATTPGVGQIQGDVRALLQILTPVRYMSRHLYARTLSSLVGGRARHDARWVSQQGALRLMHAPSWRGYLGQLLSLAGWSGLPLLGTIKQPVLVVTGDDDPLTPVVNSMMLAHMLPNARLLVLPGEGHLIAMDGESAAHGPLREFLTAPRLDRAAVWRNAARVSAEELQTALFAAPLQLPPLSVINARARRRWLFGEHGGGEGVDRQASAADEPQPRQDDARRATVS